MPIEFPPSLNPALRAWYATAVHAVRSAARARPGEVCTAPFEPPPLLKANGRAFSCPFEGCREILPRMGYGGHLAMHRRRGDRIEGDETTAAPPVAAPGSSP